VKAVPTPAIRAEIVGGIAGERRNWIEIASGRHAAIAASAAARPVR